MKRNVLYSVAATVLIALCLVVLAVLYVMPKLTAIDSPNVSAVELALANSPLAKAQSVEWFTGGQPEQTVVGTDALGRRMYVVVTAGQQLLPVYASNIVSRQTAIATSLHLYPDAGAIVSTALGLLKTPALPQSLCWQVVARVHGRFSYTYLSAYSDHVLWNFTTSDTFRLWDQ